MFYGFTTGARILNTATPPGEGGRCVENMSVCGFTWHVRSSRLDGDRPMQNTREH